MLAFLILLTAVFSSSANAYFEFDLEKKSIQTLTRHSDEITTTASHILALSDNDEFHCSFFASKKIPAGELDHFVFADYIPVTEIVTQLNARMVATEFSVEDLLYANLRIVGFLNEYEVLRKNAGSVLKGLEVPLLQWKDIYKTPVNGRGRSISGRLEQVVDQANLVAQADLPVFRTSGANGTRPQEKFRSAGFKRRHFSKFSSMNEYHRKPFHQPRNSIRADGNENKEYKDKQTIEFGIDRSDEKPWPIQVLIFIFSNKFIAISFFAMIYIAFWTISVLRKK